MPFLRAGITRELNRSPTRVHSIYHKVTAAFSGVTNTHSNQLNSHLPREPRLSVVQLVFFLCLFQTYASFLNRSKLFAFSSTPSHCVLLRRPSNSYLHLVVVWFNQCHLYIPHVKTASVLPSYLDIVLLLLLLVPTHKILHALHTQNFIETGKKLFPGRTNRRDTQVQGHVTQKVGQISKMRTI